MCTGSDSMLDEFAADGKSPARSDKLIDPPTNVQRQQLIPQWQISHPMSRGRNARTGIDWMDIRASWPRWPQRWDANEGA
jgi:hypothetical protein